MSLENNNKEARRANRTQHISEVLNEIFTTTKRKEGYGQRIHQTTQETTR